MGEKLEVIFDGEKFEIPMLTIDQHERLITVLDGDARKVPFAVLGIALERAYPKVEKLENLAAPLDEIKTAVTEILAFAGYKGGAGATQ